MKITHCRVNHLTNPLGYHIDCPVFSWQVEDAVGKSQTAARIVVKSDNKGIVADTDWASLDSLATTIEIPLSPRTRYTWSVAVRTDAGEEAESDENFFETGKIDEPWTAKWIGCDDSEPRHPVFKKELTPKAEVSRARLYICGLGLYEVFLNGERVGDEYMTPYCNNYASWVQYQTYDVTKQLQSGGTLAVHLGNGWYRGRFGFTKKTEPYYGDKWGLIAELHIDYADGTREVICTDESWTVARSNITFSNIYDGEHRDDTLPCVAEAPAALREPPKCTLSERRSLPVRIQEELIVKEVIYTPAGETVLDMGQNLTGSFRLSVDAPKGTEVRLQFGEILQNGCFYRENLRSAKAEYIYISDGTPKVIQPHFTFYGYRYVKIEGLPNFKAEDFTALVLHSDIEDVGRVVTGNALVNQLISNIRWGQKGNFLDVPTDCPQRDERMGWTGDAQVFAATACYQTESCAFYEKYLYDISTEQPKLGGGVPVMVPSFGDTTTAAAWSDAICIMPMTLYRFYGDKSLLKRFLPAMRSWVDYVTRLEENDHEWRKKFHYGDWLALDSSDSFEASDDRQGGTETAFIAMCYYLYSARLTAEASEIVGDDDGRARYCALEKSILNDIRSEYFTASGRISIQTQTAYLLALHLGLSVDPERMRRELTRNLKRNGGKLQTGFVGTPLLCSELTRAGFADMAYDLLLNEEYPGWLYAVKLGATTIWERWNSVLPDGSISSTGMNSLNHYAYGSVAQWIYESCAGISPAEAGFRKAYLRPFPDERLSSIESEYRSAAGLWRVSWKLADGALELSVEVPFGCTGLLSLPYAPTDVFSDSSNHIFANVADGICVLKAGKYHVKYAVKRT